VSKKRAAKAPPGPTSPDAAPGADEELTPEVKLAFTMVVERLEKRRRIKLVAYLLALVVMVLGLVGALLYMAAAPKQFRGWALFLPLLATGTIFWVFGRWEKRT
jgi:peptidoglycan/LPS O-acetylase OafA/YrhL